MSILPGAVSNINIDTDIEFKDYPTYTYFVDPVSNQIRGMANGLKAMTQAVEIILSIERYKFSIYTANTGVEFDGLIGQEYGYVISELKRRINDSFVPDNRIVRTENWDFEFKASTQSLIVSFLVITVFGSIPEELEVNF